MKNWRYQGILAVATLVLALTAGQALVVGPEARAAGGGTLEGNWLMESTLVNCATGDPLPIPGNPFPAVHTYLRGGTALDIGAVGIEMQRVQR